MHDAENIQVTDNDPHGSRKLIHGGWKEMEWGFEDLRICSIDNRTSLLFLSEHLNPSTVSIQKHFVNFLFSNYILIFLISIPSITVLPFCPDPILYNIMLIPFFPFISICLYPYFFLRSLEDFCCCCCYCYLDYEFTVPVDIWTFNCVFSETIFFFTMEMATP